MSNLSKTTRDHEVILQWAEERGGKPSHLKGTGGKDDPGILRIDFPGYSGEGKLEPISWDDFFEKFDERGLAFVYQDVTSDGEKSNFNKFVNEESVEEKEIGRCSSRSSKSSKAGAGSIKGAASDEMMRPGSPGGTPGLFR
jgi:hypothetical protein